jgi:hypothetical protein
MARRGIGGSAQKTDTTACQRAPDRKDIGLNACKAVNELKDIPGLLTTPEAGVEGRVFKVGLKSFHQMRNFALLS